ncbi:MAG: hypothetical protein ABGY41_22860 [Candidatus Poribacteria bacterium]
MNHEHTIETQLAWLRDHLQKDHDILTAMHVKVDQLLSQFKDQVRRIDEIEERVRVLEYARWKMVGVVAAASVVVPVIVTAVVQRLMK